MQNVRGIHARGWLAWLLAVPALVLAAVFGFFVFLAVLGLALLIAIVLRVRLWWLRRQLRRAPASAVIKGEYTVMPERRRDDSGQLR